MSHERFLDLQRKGVNAIFAFFVGLLTLMWTAALLDNAFSLGWGWDRQILWLGPLMVIFGVLVRFCALAIFRFVGRSR